MNLSQLTDELAQKTGASKALSRSIIKEMLGTIKTEVKKGNKVVLVGFGTFERAERKSRKARNPATGEQYRVPERNMPKFKPGKHFKDLLVGRKKVKAIKTKTKDDSIDLDIGKKTRKKAVSKKKKTVRKTTKKAS